MPKLNDLELKIRIKIALIMNPHIGGLEIGVECLNGIVFLTGEVQDETQSIIAERIVREYGGIEIKNDIKVLSGSSDEDSSTNSTEEDLIITQRVLGALENDNRINSFLINIESNNGVVKISGIQPNSFAKERAIELISGIQGVKTVIDDIKLEDAA